MSPLWRFGEFKARGERRAFDCVLFGRHNEVIIVGSARLGFSIAPEKRYRPSCNFLHTNQELFSPSHILHFIVTKA